MRTRWVNLFLAICSVIFAAGFVHAKTITLPPDNAMAKLKPAPGIEKVQAYCGMCHSTDYIVRQPRVSAQAWKAEVSKMITTYGAPIPEADAKVISEYLASTYGAKPSKSARQKDRR